MRKNGKGGAGSKGLIFILTTDQERGKSWKELSMEFIDTSAVLQYSLGKLEDINILPDIVVVMRVTYPFRSKGFKNNQAAQNSFDVIPQNSSGER